MVSQNPNPFLYCFLLFPGKFILPVEVGLISSLLFYLTYYYLFIFGCAGSLLLVSFSLVMNRDSSLVAVNGFLTAMASLVAECWL